MAELFKVNAPVRKPLFEGVQGENEARSIQFDITPWVTELGDGAVTATAKRSQDSQPYPVTVTKDGNVVTWKPTSTDTAFAGVGSFQLEYTVDDVLAKTCIWSTMVAPSLDPAGDPPDPYDNWLAEMRQIAADAIQSADDAEDSAKDAEAWAVGQRGGVDVPSTDPTYENNSKYWAEQSLANQYGAYIVKSASGDIASFNDGADDVPMKSVNVTITPKQSGSGDPSPSNVRPITGWTNVNATVDGKNLLDTSEMSTAGQSGVTFARSSDGIITVGGHANSNTYRTVGTLQTKNGVQYTLTGSPSGGASGKYRMTVAGYGYDYGNGYTFTGDGNAHLVSIDIYTNYPATGSTLTFAPMIRLASETDDTYVPYAGHTAPVPLGQTVYGGEVDVTEGEGKAWNVLNLGNLTWQRANTNIFYTDLQASWKVKLPANANTPFNGACEALKVRSNNEVYNQRMNDSIAVDMAGATAGLRLWAVTTQVDSSADFKALMANVKLAYELDNPTTFTTTPVSVPSLLGTNNVWADCGDIAVEYRADPTLAYNELANVIVSLGGNL